MGLDLHLIGIGHTVVDGYIVLNGLLQALNPEVVFVQASLDEIISLEGTELPFKYSVPKSFCEQNRIPLIYAPNLRDLSLNKKDIEVAKSMRTNMPSGKVVYLGEVDSIFGKSPTLYKNLRDLKPTRWRI